MNGFDKTIPWPKNMPKNLKKSAKRLDLYNKREKLDVFLALEQEKMEGFAKMAECTGEISLEDLNVILTKIGL